MKKSFDEEWEKIHAAQEWGKYPVEAVIRFIARNYYKVPDRSEIKILDFGCGGGAHTWYLAREGFDTYAFDGSKSAIEKVEKYLKKDGLEAKLEVKDGIEIDYEDNFFDAVIDNMCVYATTLENIKTMYSKIYNTIKNGGRLFTSGFSVNMLGYGTGEMLEYNTYKNITEGPLIGRGAVHFYEDNELSNILKEAGFTDVVVEPMEYIDRGCRVSILNVTANK